MRIFLLCIFWVNSVLAEDVMEEFIKQFRAGQYDKVCQKGLDHYYAGRTEEMFVMLVGTACARVDNINPLGMMQRNLVSTKSARETASYFSTLVLQKRLVYQFMIDGTPISSLKLPYSNHVISIIFDQLANESYIQLSEEPKMIKVFDGDKTMIVSVSDDEPIRILVDEYKDGKVVKRRWFQ